jgi:hypothetical protein
MKYLLYSLLLIIVILHSGCYKSNQPQGSASLTVVNAVAGSPALVTNFNSNEAGKTTNTLQYYKAAKRVSYGGSTETGSFIGPTTLSLATITDTLENLWSGTLNLQTGMIYSFFLLGEDTAHIDTLFITDAPPYHSPSDSSIGIRFVNLTNGDPVSVDIQGQSNGSEVSSLSYKNITSFKSYPALASSKNYIFEFRDVTTGNVLGSLTLSGVSNGSGTNTAKNNYRYKNFTMALMGSTTFGQSVSLINNY